MRDDRDINDGVRRLATGRRLLIALVLVGMCAASVGCGGSTQPPSGEDVYVSESYGYWISLSFTWPGGEVEVLRVEEESPYRVTVTSGSHPACSLVVQVEDLLGATLTAEEMASVMMAPTDSGHPYVFHESDIPAYSIHTYPVKGQEVLHDVIVTGEFAYVLSRPLGDLAEDVMWFGDRITQNFYLEATD